MLSTGTRDLLLFTGQGSNQPLTDQQSVDEQKQLLGEEQRSAFDKFIRLCNEAFFHEIESTTTEEQSILGTGFEHLFHEPNALLVPPEAFQSHPVFEAISLYTRQILELMLFQCQQNLHHVIEASGICTGILPAILAASFVSYDSEDFFLSAVEGFRLAFWIGLRASSFCYQMSREFWGKTPCVLSVFGMPEERLEAKLESVAKQREVHISAIFENENISLSGPGGSLQEIKSRLTEESVQCRFAHVHALYHRGSEMEGVLEQTLSDVKRRSITMPDWHSLHSPLRSAITGIHMKPETNSDPASLLETALRSIFIEKVDWRKATAEMKTLISTTLDRDSAAKFRILGFGPGSRSLLHFARDLVTKKGVDVVEKFTDSLEYLAHDDIAIVGMSVNYPGAKGFDQFWDVLENGRNTVEEIPSSRFDASQIGGTKHGNFLQDTFDFDPTYFNISPREAKSMDPQQRLLLQASLDALENAGYVPNATPTFQTSSMGVYMGVATGDYVDNLRDDIDVYYAPGTLRAFLSGRISYAFNFQGQATVIDTACSSSLVALYHACLALKSGECTAALAGGVNTISSLDMYKGLARAHFLSPTGQCKPFDESADGYCRSEGCGVVVLKRLSQAIEEGDHIHGVIRGIGVNQSGTAKSITHPETTTQAALLKSVLRSSRLSPNSINVLETHGTGTQAGDYTELSTISSVFQPRCLENPLHVSSLKGNIGHSEAASGVGSLAKLLMMMDKRQIPPQASLKKLNPRLRHLVTGSIKIPTKLEVWSSGSGQTPRRALLNNFGASGSNAALVVEEYVQRANRNSTVHINQRLPDRSHHVFNLSAKTEWAIEMLRLRYISYITENSDLRLEDICYSANARRQEHWPYRGSIVVSSKDELLERLSQPFPNTLQHDRQQKTVLVFSGQGNIYMGMGAILLSTVPQFLEIVNECDRILTEYNFPPIKSFLADSHSSAGSHEKDDEIIIAQCACFVLEYALAKVLLQWGFKPDIVIGHSIGEYAAFAIAGVLEPMDALLLLATRALIMANKCVPQSTGMVACRMSTAEMNKLLAERRTEFDNMTIACINSPTDLVIAGPPVSLAKFVQYCKGNTIKHKRLDVLFGFHSAAMDPILAELAHYASSIKLRSPSIPIGSSLYGRLLGVGEILEPGYFVKHAREPVNFCGVADDIKKNSVGSTLTVMEVGPSGSTESMWKQIMGDQPYNFLTAMKPGHGAWATLSNALRSLFLQRYDIRWRAVYDGSDAKFLSSLPRYPLTTKPHFVPFKDSRLTKPLLDGDIKKPEEPKSAFLSPKSTATTSKAGTFQTPINQISRFVKAHKVGGIPLCPASVYMEIVLQSVTLQNSMDPVTNAFVFENVTFEHPLVYVEKQNVTNIETMLDAGASQTHFKSESNSTHTHCNGYVHSFGVGTQALADLSTRRKARAEKIQQSFSSDSRSLSEKFSSKTIYRTIFPRVVDYGDPFLTLQELTIKDSGLEGYGTFRIATLNLEGDFVSSPVFVDTLLHSAGFLANTYVSSDVACICTSVEHALVPSCSTIPHEQNLSIYCSLVDVGHAMIADAYALDVDGKLLGCIEGMGFKKIRLGTFKALLSHEANSTANEVSYLASGKLQTFSPPNYEASRDTNSTNAAAQRQDVVTSTVRSIIKELCGLDCEPAVERTLSEIGVDSLLFIEMLEILVERFPRLNVLKSELEICQTVGDIINIVEGDNRLLSFSSSDATPPLHTSPESSNASTSGFGPRTPEVQPTRSNISILEPRIRSVFLEVCGLEPAEEQSDKLLLYLGVDSLLSIELCQKFQEQFGVNVDHESISELTYHQLEGRITAELSPKNSLINGELTHITPLVSDWVDTNRPQENAPILGNVPKLLQRGTDQKHSSPLFLFHDGSGRCGMYSRLGSLDRNVYGVCSFDSLPLPPQNAQTMEALATGYIESANLVDQHGVILAGWSFGGVLAYEVSRQLSRMGTNVKGVILIDSPVPIDHQALPQEIVHYVLEKGMTTGMSDAANEMREGIATNFKRYAAMLQDYKPLLQPGQADVPCVMLRCLKTIDTKALCGVSYPWLNDTMAMEKSIAQWEKLLHNRVPVLELDCNHFEVFDSAHIGEVTRKLLIACELLEGGTRSL